MRCVFILDLETDLGSTLLLVWSFEVLTGGLENSLATVTALYKAD
jgi:hypothetical protein